MELPQDISTMQALLSMGANVDHQGGKTKTALIIAARRLQPEVIKILLQNGAQTELI